MAEKTTAEKPKPFDHGPDRPVFVLVPFDALDRQYALQHLDQVQAPVPEERVKFEIRLARLPHNAVLYVVHPRYKRQGLADKKEILDGVHISAPIFVDSIAKSGFDDDGLAGSNLGAFVDRLATSVDTGKGVSRLYRPQLSADKIEDRKVVKLLTS